jgi:hypothetical protein
MGSAAFETRGRLPGMPNVSRSDMPALIDENEYL